jgi:hypothetical protein
VVAKINHECSTYVGYAGRCQGTFCDFSIFKQRATDAFIGWCRQGSPTTISLSHQNNLRRTIVVVARLHVHPEDVRSTSGIAAALGLAQKVNKQQKN